MQFVFFYLFWGALTFSCVCASDPYMSTVAGIATLVTVLMWAWVRNRYDDTTRLLKPCVGVMFAFAIFAGWHAMSLMLLCPAFLIYIKTEGGYQCEQQT